MLSNCFSYSGHTIYNDGRLYQNYELVKHCASVREAKALATKRHKQQIKEQAKKHHNFLLNTFKNS